MNDDVEFLHILLMDALRPPSGPEPSVVKVQTDEATELLLYGPGPTYPDHGVLVIPADLTREA